MSISSRLILAFTLLCSNPFFAQNEDYYKDNKCKIIYCELSSSKIRIYYGNGMEEEIAGKPELLIATVSNTFIKNNYELQTVLSKPLSGESKPGFLFFIRKEEEEK